VVTWLGTGWHKTVSGNFLLTRKSELSPLH